MTDKWKIEEANMADEQVENTEKALEAVPVEIQNLNYIDKIDLSTVDYEQLVEMGRSAGEAKIYSQWLLGKLSKAVMDNPKKYGELTQYAKETRVEYNSLKNYLYIYRRFTDQNPNFNPMAYYGSVPWGVFALVAAKAGSTKQSPEALLNDIVEKNKASDTKVSYSEVKEKENTLKGIPDMPKIKLRWNEKKKKYDIKLLETDFALIDWSMAGEEFFSYLKEIFS